MLTHHIVFTSNCCHTHCLISCADYKITFELTFFENLDNNSLNREEKRCLKNCDCEAGLTLKRTAVGETFWKTWQVSNCKEKDEAEEWEIEKKKPPHCASHWKCNVNNILQSVMLCYFITLQSECVHCSQADKLGDISLCVLRCFKPRGDFHLESCLLKIKCYICPDYVRKEV